MNKFERKGEIGKVKGLKNVKGITLIALVITIMVVGLLLMQVIEDFLLLYIVVIL